MSRRSTHVFCGIVHNFHGHMSVETRRLIGEFGPGKDAEAAAGFAEGSAEKMIGHYLTVERGHEIWHLGPADSGDRRICVWIEPQPN